MTCLQCSTMPTTGTVIGCCAACGVAVCREHATFVPVPRQPIGLVPQAQTGARRLVCPVCAAASTR